MTILAVYIVNKSGGMIYKQEMENSKMPSKDFNEHMRLASMFHTLSVIASELSPISGSSGIEVLEADTFSIHSFQALTKTRFFLITDPEHDGNIEETLDTIYDLYADYVLKCPFYELEMPIQVSKFIEKLNELLEGEN